MQLWDRLLPQTILTLNLLQQSNAVSTISAWQYVHSNFDYNKMQSAPIGCAVQLHQSSEKQALWAANAIDGWYLQTSPEHYRCHVIYVKQTKSERVSDTVFFKTKYSTQPTMMPADVITKALIDLTQALKVKGKSNAKGLEQIDALKKLKNILNNVPETAPIPREQPISPQRQVTFDQTAKPSQEMQLRESVSSPRVSKPIQRMRTATPIHTVTVDKPIVNRPTPRVQKVPKDTSPARIKMRERIRKHLEAKTMARIPQQRTYLCQTTRSTKQAQLIHDKETNTYLNYHQLLRHPKYKDAWAKSAANKFGCLAQGLKDGRVKGTDTIKFIHKDQVPTKRIKDVTY
jgi:hypothetical protein